MASRRIALLNLSISLAIASAAGVASLTSVDPEARILRYGMVLMTAGMAFWLPWPALAIAVPVMWVATVQLADNYDGGTAGLSALELLGFLLLAGGTALARRNQKVLEEQGLALEGYAALKSELDEETGVYQQRLLKESMERELARSRRFGREFAVMLADVDERRARFDYREDAEWGAALKATAGILLQTRMHVDRVYRFGEHAFALLLPETGPKDITGLLRRLTRAARKATPREGEPGGPLPLHFGVTFFPQCATSVDDLLRRAEIALRIAEKNASRVQLDGAEAPDMLPLELLRKEQEDEVVPESLAGEWLGAEAPEEEQAETWNGPSNNGVASLSGGGVADGPSASRGLLREVEPGPARGEEGAEGVTPVRTGTDAFAGPAPEDSTPASATPVRADLAVVSAQMSDEMAAILARMNTTLSVIREQKAAKAA